MTAEEDLLAWLRLTTALRVLKRKKAKLYKTIKPELNAIGVEIGELWHRRRQALHKLYAHFTPEELDHRLVEEE